MRSKKLPVGAAKVDLRKRPPTSPAPMSPTRANEYKADGWINILTGLGMVGKDKRLSRDMVPDLLNREFLESIWRGDDLAARIIETIPNEMLRQGFEVQIQADSDDQKPVKGATAKPAATSQAASNTGAKEDSEAVMSSLESLETHDRLLEAMSWERAYGGAAILVGADDGELDLSLPLREDRIRSVKYLTTLAAHEITPVAYYGDPLAPMFGQPMIYRLHPEAPIASSLVTYIEVHESRLVLFKGIKVSRRQMRANQGWGDSVLVRCWQVLSDYQQSWAGAAILLQDFAVAVMKIEGLSDLVATNQDKGVIARASTIELCRSIARMVLIDKDEEYERKVTPLTGLPEMLEKFALRVAAAADMPVSLLMGQAPAGLNATGDADIRFFYDRIAARQRTRLTPAIKRIAQLVMLAKDGPTRGREPKNWSVVHNPLWQLDAVQESTVRMNQQTTDVGYITAGVVTPEEVAVSRFGGDQYSTKTTIDFEERSPILPPAHALAEKQAAAKAKATDTTVPSET